VWTVVILWVDAREEFEESADPQNEEKRSRCMHKRIVMWSVRRVVNGNRFVV